MYSFWDVLCNTLGYRFFTGVPNASLSALFNSLDASTLHFVPAVNDSVAVGLAAGVCLAGDKAVVLCGPATAELAFFEINKLVIKHGISVFFISSGSFMPSSIKTFMFEGDLAVLSKADSWLVKQRAPVVLEWCLD